MFAYCNNNPSSGVDVDGHRGGHAKAIAKVKENAANKKYNEETIHIYVEGEGAPVDGKLNVMLKPSQGQIKIFDSYLITDVYEMNAVLDTIMQSDLYDPNVYVTCKSQAIDEWKAHNIVNRITTRFPSAQNLLSQLGWENANERTDDVDIDRALDIKNSILYGLASIVDTIVPYM